MTTDHEERELLTNTQAELAALIDEEEDRASAVPRQTCRGHLERGSSFTVGTLPSGATREYRTLALPDGRRFHYCTDPRCSRAFLEARRVVAVRTASEIAKREGLLRTVAAMAEPPAGEGDRIGQEIEELERRLLEFADRPDVVVYAERVLVHGHAFVRCSRALGLARCGGPVAPGAADCGGHA